MDLLNKDLNLLLVFLVIWEERSLSRAAERLFLSQSAVSHSLKRLRSEFADSLFVRDSRGVSPTDFAQALAPKVRQLLGQAEEMYRANESFSPKKAARDLILAAGDYFSITMLERFVARLAKEAPHVRLLIKPVANLFEKVNFEKGEVHLAVTAIDVNVKEGFHTTELRQDKISLCVRRKHPQVKGRVTPETYLKLKHLNVSNFGLDRGVVDTYLDAIGKKREVTLVTSSFFDAARLLRTSDLALSAPHEICVGLGKEYGLAVYPLPFEYRMRSISMIWHERTHHDPFHAWVRHLVVGVA